MQKVNRDEPEQARAAEGASAPVQARRTPEQRKARRKKKRIRLAILWTVFLLAAAVLIFCIVDILFTVMQRKAARAQYADIQAMYEIDAAAEPADGPDAVPTPAEVIDESKWYAPYAAIADKRIDFASLQARNPEVCGWISVEGTGIDFPVLRSSISDDFYLTHDIDGKNSEHGAICIDPRCGNDFSDRLTMVYGHNMLDGSMFAPLYNYYKDATFFDADHKVILYLDNVMLTYRVVAAYEYGHEQPLYYYNLLKDEEFLRYCTTFLENRDMKARILADATITPEDHLLTLITSTNARADQRLFVQAVLLHAS